MTIDNYIKDLEVMIKNLSRYEKSGLDTSSLRLFIKNLKMFKKLESINSSHEELVSFESKLNVIKLFLEDKKAFPRIHDIINFANTRLNLGFKDQKESREITIRRVIGRIEETPELKERVKEAVNEIKNEQESKESEISKFEIASKESFMKWAEILKNI
ncbi:hypothetical protein AAEH92_17225 [Shewanella xiamenensis]|uniref:hypothetical protein n=1 Tax=Shewanella TaxID=22 RepID=UPI0021DB470D|nr:MULTISPECIES: hypothetical protein [unclassified Shewanella]MCU8023464.1 hypothetical protein [Shewanella sp. SM78]MCU8080448.1 hypothetical protein [Shewanella sp. SM103]